MGSTWAFIDNDEGSIRIRRSEVVFVQRTGTSVTVRFRDDLRPLVLKFKTEAEARKLVSVITAA